LSIKAVIRNTINKNALAHRWFVAFCARFSMRLFSLQSYLSLVDLRSKWRAKFWKKFNTLLKELDLDKVVFKEGEAIFHYKNGCAFYVATCTESISSALFTYGYYETNETALISRVIKPSWTVIDAGANFGWYAIHFSRLVGEGGRVIAFEPVPESYMELAANLELNECKNLDLRNMALGNIDGAITMFVPEIHLGAGAASQFLDIGKKIEVPMLKLDDFLEKQGIDRVDFIKADIEGGELNLLRGAERLLSRCHPSILIEISDIHCKRFGHTPQDVIQFLTTRGYTGKYINEKGDLEAFEMASSFNGNYFFSAKTEA
jgi:FkbM family methyltransferase